MLRTHLVAAKTVNAVLIVDLRLPVLQYLYTFKLIFVIMCGRAEPEAESYYGVLLGKE